MTTKRDSPALRYEFLDALNLISDVQDAILESELSGDEAEAIAARCGEILSNEKILEGLKSWALEDPGFLILVAESGFGPPTPKAREEED